MYAELMGNHKNTEIKSFVDNKIESASILFHHYRVMYSA